jgi:hypothetical protein
MTMSVPAAPRLIWLLALALVAAGCASSPPASSTGDAAAPPADLVGEWGIQIHLPRGLVDGVLRFTAVRNGVIGSISDDEGNQSELSKLRVEGKKISWEMDRKDGTFIARGQIEGTIINGKMKRRHAADDELGGGPYGGRRPGDPNAYSWTAIKRAAPPK